MLAFFSLLVKLPIISHYFGQAERIFEHFEKIRGAQKNTTLLYGSNKRRHGRSLGFRL